MNTDLTLTMHPGMLIISPPVDCRAARHGGQRGASDPVHKAPESSPIMILPHPRFALFLIIFVAGTVLALTRLTSEEAVILGFDLDALSFLASIVPLWRGQDAVGARAWAARDDGGRISQSPRAGFAGWRPYTP
ncbi:hypothetical protein ABIE69_001984 [Rhodobacteraceae bacterium MBR-64]